MKDKVIISWSRGKDSVFSLYKIMNENELECVGLLTTFTKEYDRVTMHGVRRSLIEKQASLLNMPCRYSLYSKKLLNGRIWYNNEKFFKKI
ncbi:MAG: hypothetical protein QXF09_01525 [Nitrososphaerota archaeon]